MRAKVHEIIPTVNRRQEEKRELKKEVYDVILNELRNPSL
jgi:1-acyl-sn-glycerol-3-phosphate acyltransferase